jgi:hypothetical protein
MALVILVFGLTATLAEAQAPLNAPRPRAAGRIVSELEQIQWRAAIEAFGVLPFLTNFTFRARGFNADALDLCALIAFLEGQVDTGDTGIFRKGRLHNGHKDVGPARIDYRSFRGALGSGSMQIVVSTTTGAVFIDMDQFNPYEDIASFIGHAWEVARNLFSVAGSRERGSRSPTYARLNGEGQG